MTADIKPHHLSEALTFLRAIAANTERIADALEKANELDPMAEISRAIGEQKGQVPVDPDYVQPPDWMTRS